MGQLGVCLQVFWFPQNIYYLPCYERDISLRSMVASGLDYIGFWEEQK
jgi:hypothetical protein